MMRDHQDPFDDLEPVTADPMDRAAADTEVKRLAGLDPRAYQTERKAAAKALGWQMSFLDAEVARLRPPPEQEAEGDAVEGVEPWQHPVEGAALAETIRARIAAHVVFASRHDADLVALWVMGAYLADVWRLWPKLLVTSPTRQCGKSTLMEVLEALLPRALLASNASTAAIFRAIETFKPSLLLDEADTWLRHNEELAGIVNSGHTRRTATVLRVVEAGGQHEVRKFSTWGPMVVAGIGDQRDTLTSRSIIIGLRRKLATEVVERLPSDLFERLLDLRRMAARWADDNGITIAAMDLDPPPCGDDRRRDNFAPLYRLAAVLGGDWPARVAAGYLAKAEAESDAEDAGVMLLRDVMEILNKRRATHIGTTDLVGELVTLEGQPWAEWRNGRPITSHGVARLMRPFSIRPRNTRDMGAVLKGYHLADVQAAFIRYSAPPPPEPLHRYNTENAKENVISNRYTDPACSGLKPQKTEEKQSCSGVADKSAGWSDFYTKTDPQAHRGTATGYDPAADPDTFDPDAWA